MKLKIIKQKTYKLLFKFVIKKYRFKQWENGIKPLLKYQSNSYKMRKEENKWLFRLLKEESRNKKNYNNKQNNKKNNNNKH